jgi:hypothetical protein
VPTFRAGIDADLSPYRNAKAAMTMMALNAGPPPPAFAFFGFV